MIELCSLTARKTKTKDKTKSKLWNCSDRIVLTYCTEDKTEVKING